MKSIEDPSPRTIQLQIARRGIDRLSKSQKDAELEKAQAESELSDAKKTVKELRSRIQELNSRLNVQSQELEKLKNIKRGGNLGMAIRSPQNIQHFKAITELGYAKEQLSKLKQDMASILEEKRRAEKEIETSSLKMQSFSSKVEELNNEVEELNDELVLIELARIEAINEFRAIEAQQKEDSEKRTSAMEEYKKKMNDMIREIESSNELQAKLDLTTSDVHVLESELKQVKELERIIQKKERPRVESNFLDKDLSSLQSLKEDLAMAKKELASIKKESFQLMASMDVVRIELKHVTEETTRFNKTVSKVDSTVQNLNTKLLRAKAKLEALSAAEEKASVVASNLSLSLEHYRTEAEAAEKERVIAIEEAAKVKEEIQKTESETDLAEERLEAAILELETIKSSETTVLNNLKTLIENTIKIRESASKDRSTITISTFEYEYLTGRAARASEMADKKVAAAQAWVKALKASEKEISIKTEIAGRKIGELKMEEEQEALKTEHSLSSKIMEEVKMQKWQRVEEKSQEQSQRGLTAKYRSGRVTPARRAKFRMSMPSPAVRTPRMASFAGRRRKKVMPNIAKFFSSNNNDENL